MMSRIAEVTEQHLPYDEWLARARATRSTTSPTRSPTARSSAAYQLDLAALVVPTRSGRTRAARVGAPAARARAGPVGADRDGPAAEPPVRRAPPPTTTSAPTLDELLAGCAERARELGLAKSGDLIGITAGLVGPGPGHEPARGPPGPVSWKRLGRSGMRRRSAADSDYVRCGRGQPSTDQPSRRRATTPRREDRRRRWDLSESFRRARAALGQISADLEQLRRHAASLVKSAQRAQPSSSRCSAPVAAAMPERRRSRAC